SSERLDMDRERTVTSTTRRELLRTMAALAAGALVDGLIPGALVRAATARAARRPSLPQQDPVAAFRAQLGGIPIQVQGLAENLTLLAGPGGNVVVLHGPDGLVVVDTFVSTAWPRFQEALQGVRTAPVKFVINTHWHFDHTDNNAPLRAGGATVLAHANTRKRMTQRQHLVVLELDFPPSPAEALPQRVFARDHKLQANGERVRVSHIPPAHTDTDVAVQFENANVLHGGDVFFNGMYPYIDGSTGGSVDGMIAGVNRLLALADNGTKIVPGHGPVGNKADLAKFRDMLSTARDRVGTLKSSGKSIQEAVAAKPFADLEPEWGKGFFNGDTFVQVVYVTL
ncbi:MAG: MBL fold metallo-hydrolase, partial [Gemmatimonadales bacterium]